MKVLFLDVDGVLNSLNWMKSQDKVVNGGLFGMDVKAVQILKYIVHKTECKIVVSSAWRIGGLEEGSHFYDELKRTDPSGLIIKSVIGKTPQGSLRPESIDRNYVRGDEIQLWMDDNKFAGKFAILDDDSDMGHLINKLVKTDLESGLTRSDADKVIKLLNE